ncbi:MAG: AMP-binding protein [Planctomycetes bacterium]|nr:AMP-binding protein [Planctomycetota bacterium]
MPYKRQVRWDHWSREEIHELQNRRLQHFIREQLFPFSPFYRRLFKEQGIDPWSIRKVADLARLPLVSKEDIAPKKEQPDRPRELILQPTAELIRRHWGWPKKLPLWIRGALQGKDAVVQSLAMEYRPVSVFFTTGRTALPTAFVLSRYDLEILQEVGRRITEVTGVNPAEDRLVSLFPYAPHLAFWQVYYVGLGGAVFTLNTGGGKVIGSSAIIQSIQKIRPAYLAGIPGYVYHILREARDRKMDLSFIKGLALGGDQVTSGYRQRVKEMLAQLGASKIKVVSVLGFTEARKCWTECLGESAGGFHTYPDLEIIEIVDPETGRTLEEGQTGELVYTSLDGRGSAVLRYRTGDLIVGGMTLEPCPHCGRTVPRLASQLERVSNLKSFQLSKVKGTLVNLNLFKDELEADPRVEEWQLIIKKRGDDPFDVDELYLNIALTSKGKAEKEEDVVSGLERRLFEVTEVKMNGIRVVPLPELLDLLGMETQLKEKRIVDLRGQTSGAPQPSHAGPAEKVSS